MPFGRMPPKWLPVLRKAVTNRHVVDIGAGDLGYARLLLRLGAARVTAIEPKRYAGVSYRTPAAIEVVPAYLADVPCPRSVDTVWLSWPVNRLIPTLPEWLEVADQVIYLGHNDNRTVCGGRDVWDHLPRRKVIEAHHHRVYGQYHGALIVYGGVSPCGRPLVEEEASALSRW